MVSIGRLMNAAINFSRLSKNAIDAHIDKNMKFGNEDFG